MDRDNPQTRIENMSQTRKQQFTKENNQINSFPMQLDSQICIPNKEQDLSRHFGTKVIKASAKRYLILFLFCLNAGNKAFQWIQIPASTNKVTIYYDVSNYVINSTSVLFMIAFVILSLPSCYIIELIGLRRAVLLGSFGTALGSIVKCFCCQQTMTGVYLLFAGQILVSLSEQFIFSVPSRLASVWFPDHQVSSAVAMTVLGNSLGVALGFMVPQLMLESTETKDQIGHQLYYMFLGTAALSVFSFLADFFLFDEEPEFAPGAARLTQIHKERAAKLQNSKSRNFLTEMAILLKQVQHLYSDSNFTLLTLSYGINIGLSYAIHTILNQMLEPLWPGDEILVGNCGFIIIASGAIGSALFGHILDRSHRYRLTNILLTLASAIAMLAFGYVVSGMHSKVAIYLAASLMGLFQTGLVVGGLELAVELTYPAPELLTSSMMNVSPQIAGCICIYLGSYIIDNHGAIYTNLFFISLSLLALLILCCLRETLNRQKAVANEHNLHYNNNNNNKDANFYKTIDIVPNINNNNKQIIIQSTE